MNSKSVNLDNLGFYTSFLCAIHCAAAPLIISAVPFLNLEFIENPFFEIFMILTALVIGTMSLLPGYLKEHHKVQPLALFGTGLAIIFSSHLFLPEQLEHVFTPAGALMVAVAHILNWKFVRVSHSCADHA